MNVRQLVERRSSVTDELREITERHPEGALPADVQARWDERRAEADNLLAAIERGALVDDLDRRSQGAALDRPDALPRVTALDAIRAQLGGTDAACGRAREASQEIERRTGRKAEGLFWDMRQRPTEQRVLTSTTPGGGPGGNLIQTDVSPNVIDRLRQRSVVRQMGATVLGGLVGNLSIPRLKTSATAQWVAEGGTITASDPAFDQVSLSPHTAGGMVEMGRQLLMQSSPDVALLVEDDLARLLATALDQVAIQGGGANQPTGLLAAGSGITILPLGAVGGALTWDDVVDLIGAVDTSNALAGSLGWVSNAATVKTLRKTLKSSADTSSNFLMSDPAMLAGYPLASTQNVANDFTKSTGTGLSALIFGDWSQLLIGFWSELDILVNPYESTAYARGGVLVRAMMTADVAIRQPLAFAASTDVVTA